MRLLGPLCVAPLGLCQPRGRSLPFVHIEVGAEPHSPPCHRLRTESTDEGRWKTTEHDSPKQGRAHSEE